MARKRAIWSPLPGPQTMAIECQADELFFGGAAGGGKSSLILGAAITEHFNSIVFRREYAQLKGLKDEAQKLLSNVARYNGTENIWRFPDGQWIEFGGVQLASDVNKWQGRASDLRAFDELPHFTRAQYEFLKGWRRTDRKGQRTRIICTGNPPTDAEGDWVIDYWSPWLDPLHPNPAKDGELRWFATINGKDTEVPTGDPFFIEGEDDAITPTSRTFIRARVQDNPYYMRSGYMAVLQALPEPLRSQMLKGEFSAGREDNAWQVIPSAWVVAAQARWTEDGHNGQPMDALGVDVARGGKDNTVLTPRHGAWFGAQQAHPGSETPDGQAVIGLILEALALSPVPAEPGHRTAINMDTIAVGSSPQDIGKEYGLNIIPCVGSHGSEGRDRSGQFGFINARSEWIWMLREALDPQLGDNLAIPPSPKLRADLTAPRWKVTVRGIQVESKEDIAKRIMRSTDYGDSLVYAHAEAQSSAQAWMAYLREQAAAREQQREGA